VLRSEHVTGWKGPWVMNVFRAPEPVVPGVGRAMLVRALELLHEDGESHLGLAVTATNPARRRQRAPQPPSRTRFDPVIDAVSAEHRYAAADATSAGSISRFTGDEARMTFPSTSVSESP